MTAEELILELKDIQPPGEPGWWLPAPVTLTILGLLAGLAVIFWSYHRYRQNRRLVIEAEYELQRIKRAHQCGGSDRQLVEALSRWLKQVSMAAYPEQRPAGLTGQAWLEFLDGCVDGDDFSHGQGRLFGSGMYREQVAVDSARLLETCETWFAAIRGVLHRRGGGHA